MQSRNCSFLVNYVDYITYMIMQSFFWNEKITAEFGNKGKANTVLQCNGPRAAARKVTT
jgi:hypothetical protein